MDSDAIGLTIMETIRAAEPGEAAALADVARRAYVHYVERMGTKPAPMLEDYDSLIHSGQVWVAGHDGVLAGLVVLTVKSDHVLLDNIAVAPEAQGRGIGTQLVKFAEEHTRERGLAEVRLYTNETMTENLAYYARLGFVETHRATDHGYRRVFFTKSV